MEYNWKKVSTYQTPTKMRKLGLIIYTIVALFPIFLLGYMLGLKLL
jgi:hypothetical protein